MPVPADAFPRSISGLVPAGDAGVPDWFITCGAGVASGRGEGCSSTVACAGTSGDFITGEVHPAEKREISTITTTRTLFI
ncbi:MAG: hypothetical protein MUC66_07985 [Methanolinea sp.]|nr:hypothetical protein [Methanolinea sp.]